MFIVAVVLEEALVQVARACLQRLMMSILRGLWILRRLNEVHDAHEDCKHQCDHPKTVNLVIGVKAEDIHGLNTLRIRQEVRVGESDSLREIERDRQTHDVVLRLLCLFVPHMLELGHLVVQVGDLVSEPISKPLQDELAPERNREHQEGGAWAGSEELQLLDGSPSIDRREAGHVGKQSSSRLGMLLHLLFVFGFLPNRPAHLSQGNLENEEPKEHVEPIDAELPFRARTLQNFRLQNVIEGLKHEHRAED
mmetsp:Transcript_145625/g.363250  ORF Transcript_145625/g.363250 Transcript_145625/m.363250 type:complete len:252 (-) Transcript_145625:269-1024(-)